MVHSKEGHKSCETDPNGVPDIVLRFGVRAVALPDLRDARGGGTLFLLRFWGLGPSSPPLEESLLDGFRERESLAARESRPLRVLRLSLAPRIFDSSIPVRSNSSSSESLPPPSPSVPFPPLPPPFRSQRMKFFPSFVSSILSQHEENRGSFFAMSQTSPIVLYSFRAWVRVEGGER